MQGERKKRDMMTFLLARKMNMYRNKFDSTKAKYLLSLIAHFRLS